MKFYTNRSNCRRAAKKALKHSDFEVVRLAYRRWYWIDTSEAALKGEK